MSDHERACNFNAGNDATQLLEHFALSARGRLWQTILCRKTRRLRCALLPPSQVVCCCC
jgi:hypothetical protein